MTSPGFRPLSPLPPPQYVEVAYRPESAWSVALVDKAYQSVMPLADRPKCVRIQVQLLHPTPAGMPGEDETPALNRIADALTDLIDGLNAAFVARNTADGIRTHYFYIPKDAVVPPIVQKYLELFPGYLFRVESLADPQWSIYRNFLPLVELSRQIALGEAVLEQLRASGDDLKVPRLIDHAAEFDDAKGRDKFIGWLVQNSFTAHPTANRTDGADSPLQITFSRLGTYDKVFLHHLMYHILVDLFRAGGRYLGNGCFGQQQK